MTKGVFLAHEDERALRVAAHSGQDKPHLGNEVWLNDEYQCVVSYLGPRARADTLHLSIKRADGTPAHDWRELQAIKNEVAGWEREAIEIYPGESRLVDEADQTHLWVLPVGETVGVGFPERKVMTDDERREKIEAATGEPSTKGSQRNWRSGISTGPDYRPGG